jgi:hypothetical protein
MNRLRYSGSRGLIEGVWGAFVAGSATLRRSSLGPYVVVTTAGHRRHAAFPSSSHHRHRGRSRHGGKLSTAIGTPRTSCLTSEHLAPSKCWHASCAQGAANLKTSVGSTGEASSKTDSETGRGWTRYPTRGSDADPRTTPKIALPRMSGCALGHSGVSLSCVDTRAGGADDSALLLVAARSCI